MLKLRDPSPSTSITHTGNHYDSARVHRLVFIFSRCFFTTHWRGCNSAAAGRRRSRVWLLPTGGSGSAALLKKWKNDDLSKGTYCLPVPDTGFAPWNGTRWGSISFALVTLMEQSYILDFDQPAKRSWEHSSKPNKVFLFMYRWVLNLLETCETRLIATLRLNHMLEIASSHRMIDGLVLLLNWYFMDDG